MIVTEKKWTRRQYGQRVMDIKNKYEPLMMHWRRLAMGRDGAWHREVRFTPLVLRVKGFETAFQIIGAQKTREGAIAILESQIDEPSVPEYFRQPVRLVLEDMKADIVAPLDNPQALLS